MSIDLREWSARARLAMESPDEASFPYLATFADRLLAAPDTSLQSPDGIECMLDVCRAMHALGHGKVIVPLAVRAMVLARRENAHLRRSLNFYGVVMADSDAVAAATVAYAETIQVARASHDLRGEAGAWNNLGVLLLRRGQYRAAEPVLEYAAELGVALPDTPARSKALINLAEVALRTDRCDRGLTIVDGVLREITDVKNLDAAVTFGLGSAVRARLLARRGQAQEGLRAAREALSLTRHAGSALIRVSLRSAEGGSLVRAGEADAGLELLFGATREAVLVSDAVTEECRTELIEGFRALGNKVLLRQQIGEFVQARALIMYERTGPAIAAAALREAEEHRRRAEQMLCAQAVDAEAAEDELGHHPYRVGWFAARTATMLDMRADECAALERAGRLHDLGKAALPAWLLSSETLDLDDLAIVRRHAELTAGFLERCGLDAGELCFKAVEQAHERIDGRGYPRQLCGAEISIGAKIVAVCEAFDAMTHPRAGRPLRTPLAAMAELRRCAGAQFDSAVVEAFASAIADLPSEVAELDERLFVESGAADDVLLQARRSLQGLLGGATEGAAPGH